MFAIVVVIEGAVIVVLDVLDDPAPTLNGEVVSTPEYAAITPEAFA